MFYPVSLFVGLRYLRGRSGDRFSRFVSYMSTAGITIGVMALVTVLSVMNGFEAQLKERILGVLPQAVVSYQDETPWQASAPEFVRELSPSRTPVPIVRGEAVIQSAAELSVGYLIGIDSSFDDPIAEHLIAGSVADLHAGEYQVFLGHTLARNLNVSIGDKVRLMVTSASQFTPLGRIPSQRNFTVAGMFNTGSDIDGQLMVTHINDAARLLRLSKQTISGWRLFFDDPFEVTQVAKQNLPEGWQWSDWREQRGELFQAVKMEKNMMGLMLGLIVGVAAFNIISALIMVVMEKQAEVAILKTQGMSQRHIMTIFMVQGASSGVIGALVGGGAGVLLSLNLNSLLNAAGVALFTFGGSLPVVIQPWQIFWVILLAVLLSLVATLYPSYRASSVKPAEALRYE
ncbi:transporter [Vibrio navarrensis]|uniref:Lipoprotein-releasing ABC transporter permease subunit LolC n=1 Tax=Vibrio navarrensis TaxID=29495 RepID=A0AAI9CUS7_9VIBR|nr:lipoprotein-releasing ABC transporter permease subunit LolC [Vibrio navarrensis]EGR2795805.1 lipoprotein-releasing ABC transporter permease subunit LolC [Vibrio navarrensis]EHA1125565.1 lipoprotein-releasing ABC transporter permease subunit LolC [Vibrio navarrensis]EJL6395672.1 lipoprotein-releasing ABC transporter permease subunit LolC [Vibrio navarrensis]EJL6399919.1 lipoprotein-releasing ABC transporter permease subunit LolC [Vibrio navarrensis]EJL6567638.1 lipoprotein-releasing ABC tran